MAVRVGKKGPKWQSEEETTRRTMWMVNKDKKKTDKRGKLWTGVKTCSRKACPTCPLPRLVSGICPICIGQNQSGSRDCTGEGTKN